MQASFTPKDPDYARRVAASFARQGFMAHLGAVLERVEPGLVEIGLDAADHLSQQHGYFHAGGTIAIADSAAGYAALSLFPAGSGILTSELKINLLNPASGPRLVARGEVVKPGRTLTICRGDVYGGEGAATHVATGLFTMMRLEGLDD